MLTSWNVTVTVFVTRYERIFWSFWDLMMSSSRCLERICRDTGSDQGINHLFHSGSTLLLCNFHIGILCLDRKGDLRTVGCPYYIAVSAGMYNPECIVMQSG
jgi:hypothetical protein